MLVMIDGGRRYQGGRWRWCGKRSKVVQKVDERIRGQTAVNLHREQSQGIASCRGEQRNDVGLDRSREHAVRERILQSDHAANERSPNQSVGGQQ